MVYGPMHVQHIADQRETQPRYGTKAAIVACKTPGNYIFFNSDVLKVKKNQLTNSVSEDWFVMSRSMQVLDANLYGSSGIDF